jgi:MFS transporter, DHA1 family, tetracycline resistance protein
MQAIRSRRLTLFSIFFTFFVDNLGWAIVFPIFAPLFLGSGDHFFSQDWSLATRTTVLGSFLAIFPLAQFFGAPILGEMADVSGRKKAFLFSLILTFVGYAMGAFALSNGSLLLLFLSRICSGFFSGNLSICLAALSDLSRDEKMKEKFFGYLSAVVGFSFIAGTFLGGKLSDATLSSTFNFAFPLWVAAGLSLLSFLILAIGFSETHFVPKHIKFDFLEGVHNIQQALKTPKLKIFYLIFFLFLFAWNMLLQFMPIRLVHLFHFSSSNIGNVSAFMGVCWVLGSSLGNKLALKNFSSLKVLEIVLIAFTMLCLMLAFQRHLASMITLVGLCIVIAGIGWPSCTSVISNLAPKQMQGKILGMSQSMQSLAMAMAPLIGGIGDKFFFRAPFLLAAFASFIASLCYFRLKL